jgi:hypothetical protein
MVSLAFRGDAFEGTEVFALVDIAAGLVIVLRVVGFGASFA